MITNLTNEGWEIIYHRAHALLAAQLAGHWNPDKLPTRFFDTLAAIAQHDDLEKEWQEDQLTDAGAPLDFTLDRESSISQLHQLVEGALYRGRWVALMTSMHVSVLNEMRRGSSPEWDHFLDRLRHEQTEWRKALGVTQKEVDRAYAFLNWCDRLSLILCQRKLPDSERALEITIGPDDQRYDVVASSTGQVHVIPWPFVEKQFTVTVEATCLSQVSFASNDELTQALKQAPIKTLTWHFVRS